MTTRSAWRRSTTGSWTCTSRRARTRTRGHGGFWKRLLTGAIRTEHWRDDVIAAADRSHFDSSTTYLFNTAGVTHEWDRLRRARRGRIAREARDENDPAKLLTVLGVSLHQVQDFYTHTNWMEPGGILGGEGPDWAGCRGSGRSPTWFDIPADKRDAHTIYTANTQGPSPPARQLEQRPQQEPDQEHEQGLAGPAAVARVRRDRRTSPRASGSRRCGRGSETTPSGSASRATARIRAT